jgi:hypothetical protein
MILSYGAVFFEAVFFRYLILTYHAPTGIHIRIYLTEVRHRDIRPRLD